MIPSGLASDLAAWAEGDDARIAQLTAERDAVVAKIVGGGGKALSSLTQGAMNGKTLTMLPDLTATDKLSVLSDALRILCVVTSAPVTTTYAAFGCIQR